MGIGYPVRASEVDEILCVCVGGGGGGGRAGVTEKKIFFLLKLLDENLMSSGWCGVRT